MRVRTFARIDAADASGPALPWRRWAIAAAVAAVAAALQWILQPWLGARPFVVFLPALVLAAALAGRAPAVLVLAAGAGNALLWSSPSGGPWLAGDAERSLLLLYLAGGAALIGFGGWLRGVLRRTRDAESWLVTAIEGAGIGVFEVDLGERTVYLSPTLARRLGVPPAAGPQPLSRWAEHLPEPLQAEVRRLAREVDRGRQRIEHELALPRGADDAGGEQWLLLRASVTSAADAPLQLRGVAIDISQRKAVDAQLARVRAELRQQVDDLSQLHELSSRLPEARGLAEQLRLILRALAQFHGSVQGIVWLLDAAADGQDCGRLHAEASVGFDAAVLAALGDIELGAGASGLACAAAERVVIADALADPRFARFRDLALSQGFRALHSTPLIGQNGQMLGAISVHLPHAREPSERELAIADICARKAAVFIERDRAQSALAESRDHMHALLDASAVPFAVVTPLRRGDAAIADFAWTYVNRAAAALLDAPADRLAGRPVSEHQPQWRDGVAFANFLAAVGDGRMREFELHARLGRQPRWLHIVASPMRDGTLAVWFNDITERKHGETLLREADRRKDEFLATLAHELRNPLAPIRQAAQLFGAPGASAEQQRMSHRVIERQVQHMALLLDDLLDVSRITRGALRLRTTATDLATVVASAVETARPAIDRMQHELRVELPEHGVRLDADPLRVAQVLANLLSNAAKYTPPGGRIVLGAALDGSELRVEVSDNGIGIAAESVPEMFRMFSQLGAAQADGQGGSGLGIGLALAKGLVELHGGRIEARSAGPGCGSTFVVRLPGASAVNGGATVAPPPPAATAPVARRRVLIADDNRDAADTLAALLQLDGHETRLSFDGEQALDDYADFRPDICLFDIGMPGRNGYELAKAVRALPGGDRPTLIAITGWGQDSDRRQALAAGFDHHLTKPVDPQRVSELVAAAAAGSAAANASANAAAPSS